MGKSYTRPGLELPGRSASRDFVKNKAATGGEMSTSLATDRLPVLQVFTSFHSLRVTKLGDVDDPQTLSPHHTDEIIEAQISVR